MPLPLAMSLRACSISARAAGSASSSRVSSSASRSSGLSRTAAGRPLRVRITLSCCASTRSTISDRWALISPSGRVSVMTRILVTEAIDDNSPPARTPFKGLPDDPPSRVRFPVMTKRGNGAIGPHVVFAILLCALVVAQGEALAATPQPVRMKSDLSRERTFVPSGGSVVLYDQVDQPSRTSVGSSNGPGADPEDASGADDFAVPLVETWLVKAVDVVGVDFSEKPSERVRFYLDHGGHPGTVIATIRNVAGINSGGVLSIPLGSHAPTLE